MDTILTPNESTTARVSLGLSQASVARDTGINRVYISQFEGEKRILEDTDLNTLKNHFIDLGWNPEDHEPITDSIAEKQKAQPFKVRDGIVVLKNISEEMLEEVLSEI